MNRRGSCAALLALAAAVPAAPAIAVPRLERVSVSSTGEQANAAGSWWYLAPKVSLSADGCQIAFSSDATNLVPKDRNGASDVFVRDRCRGRTRRVSLSSRGHAATDASFGPAMSANGRFVAFLSNADDLVAGDRNGARDVFVRDRWEGTTTRVNVASGGAEARGWTWSPPVISADGRFVAYASDATNLVKGDTNDSKDVFVHDRDSGETTRASVGSGGEQGDDDSVPGSISADGRHVAFTSEATNLLPGDANERSDVFVRDRASGTTTWVRATGNDIFDGIHLALSANGRMLAIQSWADIVLADLAAGTTTCIVCWTTGPATWSQLGGISADGRLVAFTSPATLAAGEADEVNDAYVYDVATQGVRRVSEALDREADGGSFFGGISADGRYAAFLSDAGDLVRGDTNRRADVFVAGPLR